MRTGPRPAGGVVFDRRSFRSTGWVAADTGGSLHRLERESLGPYLFLMRKAPTSPPRGMKCQS